MDSHFLAVSLPRLFNRDRGHSPFQWPVAKPAVYQIRLAPSPYGKRTANSLYRAAARKRHIGIARYCPHDVPSIRSGNFSHSNPGGLTSMKTRFAVPLTLG